MRLHKWLGDRGPDIDDFRPSDSRSQIVFDELMSTGAVIAGRQTFELAKRWQGDYHDGVPIFMLTHRVDDAASRPVLRSF